MTDLHLLFNPRSIAIVGASDKPASIGQRTLENLVEHSRFEGDIYLVSATKKELAGRRCYASVGDLLTDFTIIVGEDFAGKSAQQATK